MRKRQRQRRKRQSVRRKRPLAATLCLTVANNATTRSSVATTTTTTKTTVPRTKNDAATGNTMRIRQGQWRKQQGVSGGSDDKGRRSKDKEQTIVFAAEMGGVSTTAVRTARRGQIQNQIAR